MLIQDVALKKKILEAMADDCSLAILKATMDRACSAMDIVHQCSLPPSSVYRKISEFVEAGILAVDRYVVTKEGKKFSLYRSTMRDIRAEYRAGQVEVTVALNEDVVGRLSRLWKLMRSQA